jgi:hypothetical protein
MRYQSEEAGDLSFEAEQLIKVLGPSPSDPEYQNLGETLDGESQGSFPKVRSRLLRSTSNLDADWLASLLILSGVRREGR